MSTELGVTATQPILTKGYFGTLARDMKLAADLLMQTHKGRVKKLVPLGKILRVEYDKSTQRVLLKNAPRHADWEFTFKPGGTYTTFPGFLECLNAVRRRTGQAELPMNSSITSSVDTTTPSLCVRDVLTATVQQKHQQQRRQPNEERMHAPALLDPRGAHSPLSVTSPPSPHIPASVSSDPLGLLSPASVTSPPSSYMPVLDPPPSSPSSHILPVSPLSCFRQGEMAQLVGVHFLRQSPGDRYGNFCSVSGAVEVLSHHGH
eukprot:TRINITY_DN3691_c0_g1_i1.p1 TRINITY_DN3691_c0_g1~~TRINITY_DN3691_c0_g1_i1.p1  ORF type:complete len:262 (+),score=38.12 TRINITY_DN3691_c0_g1_i1:49-834(+)